MKKLLLNFALLVVLQSSVKSSPRPDLTLPATIAGVTIGNIEGYGNIVANADRILGILAQFHTIVEGLYYLETPELNAAAENFRLVLDSLVESGSPIFQSLTNLAKVSTGDPRRSFGVAQADITYSVSLNEEHLLLVNQTQTILGANTTRFFENVLNNLTSNLGNVSRSLANIQSVIESIRSQNPKSQTTLNALLPTRDIRDLNAVLRQYIAIGDAAVPEIRTVVARVRAVDSFVLRVRNVVTQQRINMNSTFARVVTYVGTNVLRVIRNGLESVRTQMTDRYNNALTNLWKLAALSEPDVELRLSANQTLQVIQSIAANVASNITSRMNELYIPGLATDFPYVVLNQTESALAMISHNLSLALTQRRRNADTCFGGFNYEFDKIPRMVYNQLYSCMWDTVNDLAQVANSLTYVIKLSIIELNNEFVALERCTSLISRNSPGTAKSQAVACMNIFRAYIQSRNVISQQFEDFQQLLQKENSYSAERYNFCLSSTLYQMYAQSEYLNTAINTCLGTAA